jgi:hypothetical protein
VIRLTDLVADAVKVLGGYDPGAPKAQPPAKGKGSVNAKTLQGFGLAFFLRK